MNSEQHIVLDVPEGMTPEEAAQLLNAPGDSYFLVQVLPIAAGHRAYLRRYKEKPPTKAEAEKAHLDDATAMSILRANRGESVRTIVDVLGKAGIKRGKQWVCEQLDATCAEDGRERDALAIVKHLASEPRNEAKDVVWQLQHGYYRFNEGETAKPQKIKRSIGWARRKLEEFRAVRPQDNS